jgi:hypothetical protein
MKFFSVEGGARSTIKRNITPYFGELKRIESENDPADIKVDELQL